MYNFPLSNTGSLSELCREKGWIDFQTATDYIQALPYRRNSRKDDLSVVLKEQCGTCSTKHAFLAQLALENQQNDIQLVLGMYKMQEINTPGVGTVLQTYGLDYLPEAHNYLMIEGQRYDFTSLVDSAHSPFDVLLEEVYIQPEQIGKFKVDFHKNYLQLWRQRQKMAYTLAELWQIREACIAALANA